MKLLPIFMYSILLVLNSCKDNINSLKSFEENSISSIRRSNKAISSLSDRNYASLNNKRKEIVYGEKVEVWNFKALKLKAFTNNLIQETETLNRDKIISPDKIRYLKSKYIIEVKLLDTTIEKNLKRDIDSFLISASVDLPPAFVIEKTKNDILLFESNLSAYFDNQVGAFIEDVTVFSAIVGQNVSHLKSGELLEVSAGIGSFSLAANPTFIINGNVTKPDENAQAKYGLKVSGKGKKSMRVKILFTSNKGIKESQEFTLEYYVDE